MDPGNKRLFFEGELLTEFAPATTAAWHEQLEDLLGADWEARLQWEAAESLPLRPFYRAEDLEDHSTGVPGARPGWQICHPLTAAKPGTASREAQTALDRGAEALALPPALTTSEAALHETLARLDLADTALHLFAAPESVRWLLADAERRAVSPGSLHGSLVFDPAARYFQTDRFDVERACDQLAALIQEAPEPAAGLRLITADGRPFSEAGAGPVDSLALLLAALSEHLACLTERGVSAGAAAKHAQVVLPVGTVFFVEVARLRAIRRLFAHLTEAYGAGSDARLQVQAVTAWRPVTLYDAHLNLLRSATTGAAAAVAGGADVLAVRPFDAAQRADPARRAFASRLALNAQHILREEAHLGRAADPAAGSYYVEVLTDRLAHRAWHRFQDIEAEGGLLAALRKGTLQEQLAEVRSAYDADMARRLQVRVGSNDYPNLDEERLDDLPDERPDDQLREARERETEPFEHVRLATERHARAGGLERPAVFLLPLGTPKVRSARANFARNALGCAGFRALEHTGFASAEAGARAAAQAVRAGEAQLVACCAPDEDYGLLLPAVHAVLDEHVLDEHVLDEHDVPLLAAAPPDACPASAKELVDAFLYRGMDLLSTLKALQQHLGISA